MPPPQIVRTALSKLLDVTLSTLAAGNLLRWNGTRWANVDTETLLLHKAPSGDTVNVVTRGTAAGVAFASSVTSDSQSRFQLTGAGVWVGDGATTPVTTGMINTTAASGKIGLVVRGAASQNIAEYRTSAGTLSAYFTSAGQLYAKDYAMTASSGAFYYGSGYAFYAAGSPNNLFVAGAASHVPFVLRGAGSQSADLQQWQTSASAVLFRVNKDGYLIIKKTTAIPDADLSASELAIWLDDTVGATVVRFKAKDSAGTVRTASYPMA